MAVAAHGVWGLFPLYFHLLHGVPALEVVAHRVFWSFLVLAIGYGVVRQWPLPGIRCDLRLLATHACSSLLIMANWLLYVWGVVNGRVVECSLGYFVNPLVSVLLGVVFLHERLRRLQWAALILVALAVIWLGIGYGAVPWLSLALALSFGAYGLVRKTSSLGSAPGLMLETALLLPFAAAGLWWLESHGTGHFFHVSGLQVALLVLTGVVTTGPLLLFAGAARRIPLSLVGFIQYLTPTIQFLIGVFLFHENFPATRLVGFVLVWTGLALLVGETLWKSRLLGARSPSRAI